VNRLDKRRRVAPIEIVYGALSTKAAGVPNSVRSPQLHLTPARSASANDQDRPTQHFAPKKRRFLTISLEATTVDPPNGRLISITM